MHHVDIQIKIFKPSSFLKNLRPIKQREHCYGNHKEKLVCMTPNLVHPFMHAPIGSIICQVLMFKIGCKLNAFQ
jgi:hypothetical protein